MSNLADKKRKAEAQKGALAFIRIRAILIGLLLSALICALTPLNNIYHQATPLGGGHFPLAPFYIFLFSIIAAASLRRFFPQTQVISGQELLVIWMQMVIASGIAYTGLARTFFVNLSIPSQFSTAENNWQEALLPLLPEALYPDPSAVEILYNGLDQGRDLGWLEIFFRIPWQEWAKPLLAWGLFIILCYTVLLALINLFSRQWIHNERINFPLLHMPQLMAESYDEGRLGSFFFNPFLLWGLALPVGLHLLNGLSYYIPSVPAFPTLVLAGPYFPKLGLLSGFIKLKIYLYPLFIGFAFLTARQVSLSCWFFYLAGGLLVGLLSIMGYSIPASALGVTFGPTLARPEETQMLGAYGVFFLFILWLARHHLGDIFRQSFSRAPQPVRTEWISIRLSFWIAVLGVIAIIFWMTWLGMRPFTAFLTLGAFLMITLVACRIICQGGLAYFTLTAAPLDGLIAFFGPGLLSKVGLLVAAVSQKVLFVDLRESLAPSLLHARQIHHNQYNRRLLLAGVCGSIGIGVIVSFLAMLALCHKYGIRELQLDWATRTSLAVYENVVLLHAMPSETSYWVQLFTIMGALIMGVLVLCYHRFYWWPMHPIGYLTAYSSAMRILWFSFFLGWLCNAVCMRYGGILLYKKLRYFFIGLIIGDLFMGGSWAIIGFFTDGSYQVLPN